MNVIFEQIDSIGRAFVDFALPMLVQSGALILILLLADLLLRRKVRAIFRYWIWMLVLLKLVLPTSMSSPLSAGRWLGDELAYVDIAKSKPEAEIVESAPVTAARTPDLTNVGKGSTLGAPPITLGAEQAVAEPVSLPPAPPLSWQAFVFLIWFAIVAAMLLLLLQRALFVKGLVAQAGEANDAVTDALAHCCRRMGVKRRIGLKISAHAMSPAVCGLLRPVILLPENLALSLDPDQLGVVFLHELAHVKRGDLWVNLVQTVLQIIYFYNPLLWLANAIIRRIHEQAVDEMVLVAMGEKAEQYPQTLVNVAKLAFKRQVLSLRLTSVVESKSALSGRIKHILDHPAPKTAKLGILGIVVVVVVAAVLLPMAKSTPGLPEKDEDILSFPLESEVVSESPTFRRTLPNGMTVELMGVCEHPSKGKQWWRPDGSLLADAPYDKAYGNNEPDNKNSFEFVVQFEGYPEDEIRYAVKTIPGELGGGVLTTGWVGDKRLKNVLVRVASFPVEQKTASVGIAAAAGPWEMVFAANAAKVTTFTRLKGRQQVQVEKIIQTESGLVEIELSHTIHDTWCRVVAVDYAKRLHEGRMPDEGWESVGAWISLRRIFDLKLSDIKEFRLETRSYEWITFNNVSLCPRHKRDDPEEIEAVRLVPERNGKSSDAIGLSGRVVDTDGGPVADAQVALSSEKIGVMVSYGRLKPMRVDVESKIVETDNSGDFDLGQPPDGSFDLLVAHDKGFALVESKAFFDSYEIRLRPWGRIEGRVAEGRYTDANKIWMAGLPNPTWFLHKREYLYETACNAGGRFVFEKVPAGWFEAGYLTRTTDSGWSITSRTPVEVTAGETTEMMLGGSGRPVIGRFVPPEGYDKHVYFGNGLRSLDRTRPDESLPENYDRMTRREQAQWRAQWRKTEEYRQYRDAYWQDPNWRQYTFRINEDGSFRIEDVIAGKYDLIVWIEERLTGAGRPEEIGSYRGTIEVPEMPGGRSDEPLDLGRLELTMHEPLRVGDAAPLFEARTLDGNDIRLIDCRGKFVLLSFWQPVSHPERRRLQELYDAYNSGGRLSIIGLGGHDTLEEVRKYIQENAIPWPQIYTGKDFKSGIAKDYRLPGIPWIFLIGPDGRIIAKNLRGEELTSAVQRALGAPTERKSDVQIAIEARVFSFKTADNSIADYLYNKLGIRNVNAEASLRMPVELTNEQADEFKKWAATISGASMLVSPRATVVSGELVDQSLITQHEFIAGYKKPEAASEKPEPVLEKFTTGVKLNITPELRRDGKVIFLKLEFSKRDLVQVKKDLDESGYEIERPVIDTIAVNSSVLVAAGKSTLVPVAGLSSTGGIDTGEKPIQQTLLLIKPMILNLASGL